MGTVSTICYTDRATSDVVALSLTPCCNVARWAGTEMTRPAGTQHGEDCPVTGIIL